jgi:uncharacterized Ntn-hydrolase superfamily protein
MDDIRIDFCNKCIDDHEQRLRHIEANNKEQAKLYLIAEKLSDTIDALEEKCDLRFNNLEKWMEARVAVIASESIGKKETKSDMYALLALLISIGSFIILVYKFML